jgi:mannose-6-phosphate isomerase-like protein (cupin superfamily)
MTQPRLDRTKTQSLANVETMTDATTSNLDDLRFGESRTAFLFEGKKRAGIDISMFVVRTPPGGSVEPHTHPCSETFLPLEGEGRWTAGDTVVELQRNWATQRGPVWSVMEQSRRKWARPEANAPTARTAQTS